MSDSLKSLLETLKSTDLKTLSMDDLIAKYNELGVAKFGEGFAKIDAFKSLKEGRTELAALIVEAELPEAEAGKPAEAGATTDNGVTVTKNGGAEARGPVQGVGAFAKEQILAGKSNKEVLELVKAKFPDAKTSYNCIAYYRNALKNEGKLSKDNKPVAAEPAAPAAAETVTQPTDILGDAPAEGDAGPAAE